MIPPDRLAALRAALAGGIVPDELGGAPMAPVPPPDELGGPPAPELGMDDAMMGMPPDLGGGEAALGMEPELGMDALGGGPDGMGGGMPPPPFPSINPAMWQQMIQALIGGDAAKLAQLQQMQAQQLAQGQQDALGQAIAAIQQQAEAAGALTADGDVGAPPPLPGPSQAAAERVIGY